MAEFVSDSTKTTRIYVRWSVDGQFIRKWSREPFADGEPVDAIGRAATDGEALAWRLERIIEDGGPLTLSDKAFLREAVTSLATRAAPPAMDREAVEDAAREAAYHAIHGPNGDPFQDPEGYDYASKVADAVLSTLSADAIRQGEGEAFTGVEAWDELVNVDDRTSPEEYPDMCLITRDELIDFMERATLAPAANSSDDAGGDFACRFGGVEYSRSDLAIAQRAACAIVPFYGTGDHGEQDAARNGKLWNDHPAVQGALRALHVARLAATPKIMATSAELAALDAIDRFVTDHVGNDDTCDGIEVDERAQKAVEMLRAMFATPASHASDGGK